MWLKLLTKYGSRKFLLSLGAAIVAVLAIFWPAMASQFDEGMVRIVALIVLGLDIAVYVISEGQIDRARVQQK